MSTLSDLLVALDNVKNQINCYDRSTCICRRKQVIKRGLCNPDFSLTIEDIEMIMNPVAGACQCCVDCHSLCEQKQALITDIKAAIAAQYSVSVDELPFF